MSEGVAKWRCAPILNERSEIQIPYQENKSEKSFP